MENLASLFPFLVLLFIATNTYSADIEVFKESFVRKTGKSFTESRTFQGFGGTSTVILNNGGLNDPEVEKVSSSTVTVNGQSFFGPSDFNQNVNRLEKEINLQGVEFFYRYLKGKGEVCPSRT